jgi:hypothetical protein
MRLSEPASAFGLAFPWSIPSEEITRRGVLRIPIGRVADSFGPSQCEGECRRLVTHRGIEPTAKLIVPHDRITPE